MKKLLIALLIVLAGCSTIKPTAILAEKVVHIDARALEPCIDLVGVPDNASFEDLMSSVVTNFQTYSECKSKQDNSIKLLKQFANIKEPTK